MARGAGALGSWGLGAPGLEQGLLVGPSQRSADDEKSEHGMGDAGRPLGHVGGILRRAALGLRPIVRVPQNL